MRTARFVCRIVWLAILPAFTQAQTPNDKTEAVPTSSPALAAPEITASDVEAFFDGLVPIQLRREDIARVVIVVVKDGKVLFAKGYGYADVARQQPVSPDRTLFRPGSVSQLFTWTAVMQLVEQGKLDLDHDVSEYLDFSTPHFSEAHHAAQHHGPYARLRGKRQGFIHSRREGSHAARCIPQDTVLST
jgi:CubicO group peptidase (beta-lactamase class C family)